MWRHIGRFYALHRRLSRTPRNERIPRASESPSDRVDAANSSPSGVSRASTGAPASTRRRRGALRRPHARVAAVARHPPVGSGRAIADRPRRLRFLSGFGPIEYCWVVPSIRRHAAAGVAAYEVEASRRPGRRCGWSWGCGSPSHCAVAHPKGAVRQGMARVALRVLHLGPRRARRGTRRVAASASGCGRGAATRNCVVECVAG
jgi:hypothetical protein